MMIMMKRSLRGTVDRGSPLMWLSETAKQPL